MAIFIVIFVLTSTRHSARYYTHEDKMSGKSKWELINFIDLIEINNEIRISFVLGFCAFFSVLFFGIFRMRPNQIDGMYEKSSDSLSITGNDISFKFPMDDVIRTIDDMILPLPTQPPSSFKTSHKSFGMQDIQCGLNNSQSTDIK